MTKERRLGRGLAALLGNPNEETAPLPTEPATFEVGSGAGAEAVPEPASPDPTPAEEPEKSRDTVSLNVYEIDDNPFQPRREFNEPEIASLAESLKEHDMLQPVLVRRVGDRYQLISGERRLRAAIQAGWSQIPARIREADDRLVAELAIVENLQRKDLNPIEKALSFKRYLEEHGCTQDDLARRLKIDRSTIANLMRLLELPKTVLDSLRKGEITAGHARALLPLGDEDEQVEFARRIAREGVSVRETERQVTMHIAADEEADVIPMSGAAASRPKKSVNSQVVSLEQELRIALGTKVDIKQSARGKGKIVIQFSNHEEFERLRMLLSGDSRKSDAA